MSKPKIAGMVVGLALLVRGGRLGVDGSLS